MKVNKKPFLVAFIAIVLAMISWMLLSFKVVSAAQVSNPNQRVAINAIGLDANSAVIKDKNGNVVNGSDATTNNSYSVNYNWKIPDDVTVSAGDTATFELPSGVKLTSDLTNFPIHDEQGRVVGTFSIKANEKTGTITFNEGFNGYNHIGGTLQIFASGAKNPNDFDWNISKGGWVYDYDENGMLKNIIWNITFNPDGGVLNPKVSVEGNKISFDFGNVNKAVNMSFRVKPTVNPNGSNKWTNDAVLTSDQIKGDSSADVSWGGSGNGGGTSSSSLTLVKKDAVTGALLANAGYNLLDSEGKVVREHLTTNSNGQINLYNLPKGDLLISRN